MGLGTWLASSIAKNNPVQAAIASEQGVQISTKTNPWVFTDFYSNLEVVNRAVNMIVDDSAEIPYSVSMNKDSTTSIGSTTLKRAGIESLLNKAPNRFQDLLSFKRLVLMDFIIDGNAFILFKEGEFYHLPAKNVAINPDPKKYIDTYEYVGYGKTIKFTPDQIIHVKDNTSGLDIYRGQSRLTSCANSLETLMSMRKFQKNFFDNSAVPGLVITAPEMISPRVKERMKLDWSQQYNPKSGGRKPLILDNGMKIDPLSNVSFTEMDFQGSTAGLEKSVLTALGVPPILIDSGNNANIRPNHRVYYLETIIPVIKKFSSAYSAFFGYKIEENVLGIPALQPELSEQADYLTSLVNGGIISPNEARIGLGREPKEGHDELRIPANIAGSAVDPSQGGRPPKKTTTEEGK